MSALFAESFGSQPGIAWLHLLAMIAIAGASWRLVAVQARIGERQQPAAPYRGVGGPLEAAA